MNGFHKTMKLETKIFKINKKRKKLINQLNIFFKNTKSYRNNEIF